MIMPTVVYSRSSTISNIKNYVSQVLDFSNYPIWQSMFLPVLESHGVLHHVDGTTSWPPSFISTDDNALLPNSVYMEWKRVDAMVLSWIQATVSLDILRSLIQPGLTLTARDAWVRIESLFLSQAQSQEVQLKPDFINFKMDSLAAKPIQSKAHSMYTF
ncbi:hypothetical protein LIER_01453 [Lithospermum erythrorhizon]|uniref:Retrotransposon Copia-like N-terminal domain-containing protein n=1 Tax=Lithospermum erythrorhizon TaxID=34254 RepID=A0AAV3NL18_LITER